MNLKPSDLPLLVSLDVLLEERNVTRAALRLNVTQPALSGHLARLRRLFNDPLLVPSQTGRGMVPTPKAEEMAATLRDALAQIGTLSEFDQTFDPARDAATFRVAGSFSAIGTFARPLIRSFDAWHNRDLRIAFRVGREDINVLAQFEHGEIDVLLVPSEQIPPSLKARPLVADRFVMVQRAGHPRGRGPLTMAEYCALGHMIVSPIGRLDGLMDQYLAEQGYRRDVVVSAPDGDSIGPVLLTTDLVCTIPLSMVDSVGPGVEAFSIPMDIPNMSVAMAWPERLDKRPAHRWLREQIMAVGQRLDAVRRTVDNYLPPSPKPHSRGYN